MNRLLHSLLGSLAFVLMATSPAAGQTVFPIGPFTGTYFDDFNNDGPGGAGGHQQVTIFNGFASVNNTTPGGAIKIEFSSSLNGDLVSPLSPPLMLGQIGISQWVFSSPITRLGGYWENNSRFDDATVQFFDANNNLLASVNAADPHLAQTWTWNGWQSTVPFSSIVVTGNDIGFLNGFIWWEDFRVTVAVPEPTALVLLGFSLAVSLVYFAHRKRRALHCEI